MSLPSNSSSRNGGGLVGALLVFVVWWIVAANLSHTRPVRTAETHGFTDVTVTGSTIWFTQFRGCGPEDMRLWRVTATNPQGERRNFIVCGGMFKGNTLRVK